MTTYTYSASYLEFSGSSEEIGAISYELEVVITAFDSFFTYIPDPDSEELIVTEILATYLPLYGFEVGSYNVFDSVSANIAEVDWGEGYTSTVLRLHSDAAEGDPDHFAGEVILLLEGDALPDFTDLNAALNFYVQSFGATLPEGAWGPGEEIAFADFAALSDVTENDVIEGTDAAETLSGGLGEDAINGKGGDDLIQGGAGYDFLEGGQGADTLDGGADDDQVSFRHDPAGVVIDLREGYAIDGWGDTDELSSIEMARGSMFDDTIYGNGGHNMLRGLAGDDLIDGRMGKDTVLYDRDAEFGGTGGVFVDLLAGTATDGFGDTDTLVNILNVVGGDADDTIYGDTGFNELTGNVGSDRIYGNDGWDTIDGGNGHDRLFGGKGRDLIFGGNGHDKLRGSLGFDTLDGGNGHDTLIGAKGDDLMTGGAGNDTFIFKYNFDNDTITDFGDGDDILDFSEIGPIADFADLVANHLADGATGAVIADGNGNSVTLTGVWSADLGEADFLF
ncbi:calcium-binding protein [Mangrovicoccus ximenensis]|uniref:calcium-binding protein n=1 Tax=Mangrovicoccus ximenensis TaxID=1911570 RepID=UPI000D3A71D9|nr:calcium-binding protein [Mangrovicoccus ximenensis]